MASSSIRPRRLLNVQMIQNFHLVWLDESIDEVNDDDCHNSIKKLRRVVNTVNTFTDVGECIDFINGIQEEKTFMISSGALSQTIVPAVHDKPQVNTIYIFCGDKTRHEALAQQWPKVKGVFTDIIPICKALKKAAQDCDHNSVSISFVQKGDGSSNQNLDTLDQSFMYTQILKEILITIDFEQSHINDFLTYSREQLVDNTTQLANVDKIAKEYHDYQPIWWYTYESFLYSMLNRALRLMEVDRIIKMGFFVRDLHQHIAKLHTEQFNRQNHSNSFIVYRGQGLSQRDFDQLKSTQNGLLAFNNFLSTSKDRRVSLNFAQQAVTAPHLMGVLFVMNIDPSISATVFANVKDVGYYQAEEEEILFSMHSVFRIGQVQQIDRNNRLYEVNLILTSDNDPQLHALTKSMKEETTGYGGWDRLGMLMIKLGQFNQAKELYNTLFEQANDERGKAHLYYQLGIVKDGQGKYAEAVEFYKNSIKINQTILRSTHPHLASSYSNIGLVYDKMGEYSKALSYYEKALEIFEKTLSANHSHLASSYNNIGSVYHNMGDFSKALSYYEKAVEIRQKTLPGNHPHLASSYNNIGSVYQSMNEYSKALSYYKKAFEIRKETLSANHRDLATSYNNIGLVYKNMGEYSKAFSYYKKALKIFEKTLPKNHPDLATSYNNIGLVYNRMGEYSKALSYYEKALEIFEETLHANHPSLATFYNNIGLVYNNLEQYSKSLSCFERALDIWKHSLHPNHPHLQSVKKSIELVKKSCQ